MNNRDQKELSENIAKTAKRLQDFYGSQVPLFAITLGSGLKELTELASERRVLDYSQLPAFPSIGVAGHGGQLELGKIAGKTVMFITGRAHYYERQDALSMKGLVQSIGESGVKRLLLTNAAGSTDPDIGPGELIAISDHISFTGVSPLFFESDNSRFVDMSNAYSPSLRSMLQSAAEKTNVRLSEGVYGWFCGPHFETPAEVKMAKMLGCSAVGMSTAPEVILARHAKIECAAISVIANAAAGMSNETLSHQHTLEQVAKGRKALGRLLEEFLKEAPLND